MLLESLTTDWGRCAARTSPRPSDFNVSSAQAFELRDIAGLCRSDERVKRAVLGAADGGSPSIRDMPACAGGQAALQQPIVSERSEHARASRRGCDRT